MVWLDFIGNEFKDTELDDLKNRFSADGFYCKLKNSHEYEIGLQKEDSGHALLYISRDRVMVMEYNFQIHLTTPEIALVAHKLELVRRTGLEDVIRSVNSVSHAPLY